MIEASQTIKKEMFFLIFIIAKICMHVCPIYSDDTVFFSQTSLRKYFNRRFIKILFSFLENAIPLFNCSSAFQRLHIILDRSWFG